MLIILIVSVMVALCLLTEHSPARSQGMMRSHAMIGGAVAIGILFIPNLWLQGLSWILLINWLRDRDPGQHISRVLPFFVLLAIATLLMHHLEASFIFWGLVSIVVGGSIVGAWALASRLYFPKAWEWKYGPLWFYDSNEPYIHAGQENPNNTQSVCVISLCAAVGLAYGWSPWWWLGVILPATGVYLMQWAANLEWQYGKGYWKYTGQHHLTLGPIILAGVAIGFTPLVIGWWSTILFFPVSLGLLWGVGQAMRYEVWWDSYRVKTWVAMLLTGWWNGGWLIRLLGRGWGSWLPFFDFMQQVVAKIGDDLKRRGQQVIQTKYNLSTAHNEFVQILFEHGLLSFLLVAGYVSTSLWRLAHGSAEAQAVYLVVLALCGVAAVLHPMTYYHNTGVPTNAEGKPAKPGERPVGMLLFSIGCPTLNWMSFLIILMVELVK